LPRVQGLNLEGSGLAVLGVQKATSWKAKDLEMVYS
jgi:hypothetical protein